MRVYLDLCCLKRPFDAQVGERVRLETEAMKALLGADRGSLTFLRTRAHLLENSLNPLLWRREAVRLWLEAGPLAPFDKDAIGIRTAALVSLGIAKFDALHLSSAEAAGADVFVTADDRLRRRATALRPPLPFRVVDPLVFSGEVYP